MGSSNCLCNINNENNFEINPPKYNKNKIKLIIKIQNYFRRIISIRQVRVKSQKFRTSNDTNYKLSRKNLIFKFSWENDIKSFNKNFDHYNLSKLGHKLEISYSKTFKGLKKIDSDKPALRLHEEAHFDPNIENFFKKYKILIYKTLASYFNIGKHKDHFERFFVEIESNIDACSIFSGVKGKQNLPNDNTEWPLISKDKNKTRFK